MNWLGYSLAIVSNILVMILFFAVCAVIVAALGTLVGKARAFFASAVGFLGSLILGVFTALDSETYQLVRPFFLLLSAMFLLAGIVANVVSRDKDRSPTPSSRVIQWACQIGYLIVLVFWVRAFEKVPEAARTQVYRVIGTLVLGGLLVLGIVVKVLQAYLRGRV